MLSQYEANKLAQNLSYTYVVSVEKKEQSENGWLSEIFCCCCDCDDTEEYIYRLGSENNPAFLSDITTLLQEIIVKIEENTPNLKGICKFSAKIIDNNKNVQEFNDFKKFKEYVNQITTASASKLKF